MIPNPLLFFAVFSRSIEGPSLFFAVFSSSISSPLRCLVGPVLPKAVNCVVKILVFFKYARCRPFSEDARTSFCYINLLTYVDWLNFKLRSQSNDWVHKLASKS